MEVEIERILPGGLGLAHAEGRTIMVPLSAPGDRLRVKIEREKGNVTFASIVEIVQPSPERVEPPCPYFGRCGGCDFQQLNYQAQLKAKAEIIKDCLRRLSGLSSYPDFEVTAAPNPWHYRARAQWQYDSTSGRLGYFEAGSRVVCDVLECAVLTPELQEALADLRTRINDDSLPETKYFRAIGGDEGVSITPNPETKSAAFDIHLSISGESYRLNAESFFQTNAELLPRLIDAAIGEATGSSAIELYCGVGLFTLPVARRFKHVIGIEDDARAVKFARANVTAAGLTNAEIVKAGVGDWIVLERSRKAQRRSSFGSASRRDSAVDSIQSAVDSGTRQIDFLLLDPPRTGAESRVIHGIIGLKPTQVCYVSCDPATLARDLKKLIAGGYTLDSIAAFDMFPQTHHVETVVHLSG